MIRICLTAPKEDEHIQPHRPVGFDMAVVHIVTVGPGLDIATRRILAEVVEVPLHTCSVVAGCTSFGGADRTSSVEDMAVAAGSTAVVGRVVTAEVVAKAQADMVTRRRTGLTVEEYCTPRGSDVEDRAVVAMTLDTVLVRDSGPPARAGRICS